MVGLTKSRSANGQFPKGQSGNPCGHPRDEQKVAELARSSTREAIETLAELMRSLNDERVRGTVVQALLDRGWGKPKVEVVSDEFGCVQALKAVATELDESVRISPNNAEAHHDTKKIPNYAQRDDVELNSGLRILS